MFKHSAKAIDPQGGENRRWQCVDCNKIGTLSQLLKQDCIADKLIDQEKRLIDAIFEE